MSTLYYIPYSPWSLKALRVMRHHGMTPTKRNYVPFMTERELRKAMGGHKGKVTVPVWIDGDRVFDDSHAISIEADAQGKGEKLFLEGHEAEMQQASDLAGRICGAARGRSLIRVLDDTAAVKEALPKMVTRLPLVSGTIGKTVLKKFNAKYGITADRYGAFLDEVRDGLTELRTLVDAAEQAGRTTLYATFSYADVALGLAMNLVQPLPETPMGEASMRCATDDEVRDEFADLVAWRDRLDAEVGLLP